MILHYRYMFEIDISHCLPPLLYFIITNINCLLNYVMHYCIIISFIIFISLSINNIFHMNENLLSIRINYTENNII